MINEASHYAMGLDRSRSLVSSALPTAPVVVDDDQPRIRTARRWGAARLRTVARGTYHLANRVDPVRLPQRA